MDTKKELYTCSGSNIPVTNTTVSEEYIVKQRQVMNETELVELREQKTVKNILKSSSWGLLAAAVREKHFRIMQEMKTEKADSKASSNSQYVGWEGLKLEKESDRGKVGRIVTGQREELDALRNMHLVQKSLKDEEMVNSKASKLFGLTPSKPSIYVKKHSNNILVTKYPHKHSGNTLEKSVRANSQAFVGTVFSVPSKSKRVLERLTSRQLDSIADAEKKLRKQVTYNYRSSQVKKRKQGTKSQDELSTTDSSDIEMSGKHQSRHHYLSKRKSDCLTGHHFLDEGKHNRTKNRIDSNDLFTPNVSPNDQLSDDTIGNLSDVDTACTLTDNEMPPSLHGAPSSPVTAESPLVISHHQKEEMVQFSSYIMENVSELEMTSKEDERDEEQVEVVETMEVQSTTILTARTTSIQTDGHSVSDSSQSSFDRSSSEASSQQSSYVSQTSGSSISHTSFECDDHELDNDNEFITEEDEDNNTPTVRPSITSEPILTSTFFPENLSESQQSIINSMINDDELPTLPPLTTGDSQPVVNNNRNSWSWLDSYKSRFTRTISEESAESAYSSVDVRRYSIDSPQISDSAFNTPAHDLSSPFSEHGPKQQGSHNTRHPLGRDIDKRRGRSSTEDDAPHQLKRSTKSTLPQSAFDDPGFVEFCKNLDHTPNVDDYAVYKILLMSEDIEEKYGKKIESAIQEAFVFALKDKLSYFNFAKISHRLALQAKYAQEQAFLITCLGRRILEKLPGLEEVIATYTTQVVEEMAGDFMLGLHLSGDTHNPEMRWDYDDWSELLQERGPESDINKVLNENTVPPEIVFSDLLYQSSNHSTSDNNPPIAPPPSNEPVNHLILPTIRRVSSVEVLIADNTSIKNQSDQRKLVVPDEVLQRRRSWSSPLSPFSCPPLPLTDHMIKTTDHMTETIDQMTHTTTHIIGNATTEMSDQVLSNGHVTNPDIDIEDTVFEAKNTEQVSLHLEESRCNPLSSKPIIISLSQQESTTSSVGGRFIRTFRGTSTSSSLSSYTPDFTDNKDWTYSNHDNNLSLLEVEEEVEMRITTENLAPTQSHSNTQPDSIEVPDPVDTEVNDPESERREGRRRSSLQVLSDTMTSPVITIGLPLVVLAAITLRRS